MSSSFLEQLREQVLVGDGALGTLIYARGVGWEINYDSLNLIRPEFIRQIHQDYVAAGAQAIETNTFGANRARLEPHGLADKTREINLAGARLAREVAGREIYVLGSVGPAIAPAGHPESPPLSEDEIRELFREPIVALAEGGVDALLLETFSDLGHLRLALEVARQQTDLPVICQLAFQERGHTYLGVSAAEAVKTLINAGADAIGANCGRGVKAVMTAIETMTAQTDLPVTAFPNAGLPEYVDGRYIYMTTPQYLAESASRLAEMGVNLVGGCCGTTPEHTRAIAERIQGRRVSPRRRAEPKETAPSQSPAAVAVRPAAPVGGTGSLPTSTPTPTLPRLRGRDREGVDKPPAPPPALAGPPPGSLLHQHPGRPFVVVELDPPRGLDYGYLLRRARQLADMGVDAITCGDNPVAMLRMENLAFAQIIQQETGLTSVVHLSCRDRNLLGTQSYLLAAHTMGIHHVLALTGDPARVGDQPGASSVYDLNSFSLIQLIQKFNAGRNHADMEIGGATRFTIGVALNPHGRNLPTRIDRLRRKFRLGAHFAMSQPIFDPEMVFRIRELAADIPIPIFVGLVPLLSQRNAEYLHHEVPGIELTPEVLARMKGLSGKAGREMGVRICQDLIDAVADVVDGFYIVPPQGRTDTASALVAHIQQRLASRQAP